jgi:hypothetical protein
LLLVTALRIRVSRLLLVLLTRLAVPALLVSALLRVALLMLTALMLAAVLGIALMLRLLFVLGHVQCSWEAPTKNKALPRTVPGSTNQSLVWNRVAPRGSARTYTCLYDRS